MDLNKVVNFSIEKFHSSKLNKDIYGICIVIGSIKKVIAWLNNYELEQINDLLSK